ncbi:hypothetical protein K491DRAFT_721002 [Lophiostoma macrostomum CBS 122681]|uniref:Uncharacterized protein n=1 Tax=Lophiostoma macrostomum CBS 122681 TaxID=1314788 RepID=A0A6A6SRL1_9PLEO|nr:hypothetical protein K491DRAFT_721002 [Lophiostoma macrostomum CBS 122681]
MDIRKWIDETVLPEQIPSPNLAEQLGIARFLHPKQPERPSRGAAKRKRSTSDSSLLDTRTTRKEVPPATRAALVDDYAEDSGCSNASSPADPSSESSASSQSYARRPRRKTRPERYEPALKDAKERGTRANRRVKNESKKNRRKSKRKKTDHPGVGLVQSFRAKNIPRDRLTLKPREKLGLFNLGKASSPVKGRGLPDLVFSEMKFLQKHKSQPEVPHQTGLSNKKRKTDQAHTKQEEISAYFTSVRPTLPGKDVNIQAKDGTHSRNPARNPDHGRERSLLIDNAIPTIELPDETAYLGFGAKGPRHESGSYISWSESIRAPSATPVRTRGGLAANEGQLDSIQSRPEKLNTDGGDVLHSQSAPRSVPILSTESGERFNVSSLTPANHRIPRSHSFPQQTCSPRPLSLDGRQTSHPRPTTAGAVPSSTPAAPHLHRRPGPTHGCRPVDPIDNVPSTENVTQADDASQSMSPDVDVDGEELEHGKEDVSGPQMLSGLRYLLQDDNSAFNDEQHQNIAAGRPNQISVPSSTARYHRRSVADTRQPGMIRSLPTVRFSGVETFQPIVQTYAGANIYEEQARRLQLPEQEQVEDYHENQEADLLGKYSERQDWLDWEEDWRALQGEDASAELETTASMEASLPTYGLRGRLQDAQQTDDVVARGFWRPNRLY